MISYTHRNVTTSAILITILIFGIINFSYSFFQNLVSSQNLFQNVNPVKQENTVRKTQNAINNLNSNVQNNVSDKTNKTNTKNTIKNEITNKTNSTTKSNTSNSKIENLSKLSDVRIEDWRIVIPTIELNAQISEGTDSDVMDMFVGHFENTSVWLGNIALAGHNRGYPVNYFARIKELSKGDIIQYYYQGILREYAVQTVTIIKDTDWSYLGETTDNRITLITCVEDEPEYRRCIQAIEI